MLRLFIGRAGSGKTSYILREISEKALAGGRGNVLIVPEQYSHDCERALAAYGDAVCLGAEVLSFTRLAQRVFAETGGLARPTLDAGGRTLAMSLAYMSVSPLLKVYDVGGRRPDFVRTLLEAYDELKSARTGAEELSGAADRASGTLAGKLSDLALIFERFEAIKEKSGADARDKLERLADQIGESSVGTRGGVWIDGFTDFTRQELRVIDELLKKGADVTVCLGTDSVASPFLTFRLPSKTAARLLEMAKRRGVPARLFPFTGGSARDAALAYLERALPDYAAPPWTGACASIEVWAAASVSEECAVAAAKVSALVRAGARYRDIAVVSPSYGEYAPILEGVFAKYGVPLTGTEKSDILDKPAMALLMGALDILQGGWDYQSVFKYLKTGLSGLTQDGQDRLENYVLKWNIRGESAWKRQWDMPPEGYSDQLTPEDRERLLAVNELRRFVSEPLLKLGGALASAPDALGKVRAVYTFMEDVELYGKLTEKARALRQSGRTELAGEYRQLWGGMVGALSQFAAIMGDTPIERDEFIRLLKLVLGQYRVGVIPASVDSVRAGDMTRLRARGIRHLIVLGAVDGALPVSAASGGVFSDTERAQLKALGIDTLDDREDSLARELSGVYVSLTVPTESLTFTYPAARRRSYVVSRVEKLFGLTEHHPGESVYTAAPEPCFELAASGEGEAGRSAGGTLRAILSGGRPWRRCAWPRRQSAGALRATRPKGCTARDCASPPPRSTASTPAGTPISSSTDCGQSPGARPLWTRRRRAPSSISS